MALFVFLAWRWLAYQSWGLDKWLVRVDSSRRIGMAVLGWLRGFSLLKKD